ncbi:MAG TPA: acyl-CoA dehydrogenase family protein [Burkholderiales bacterium]|nr:acyl-CoA dehydrogenase family protein [Burkholderiales bacterium]
MPGEAAVDYNALPDDEFRARVRAFVESRYPEALRFLPRRVRMDEIRVWWNILAEHGWVAPNWPREWGGMGLEAGKMVIFLEEMERHGVARAADQGITQVGPILMKYGTDAQKAFYLPRTRSGEIIWCQGYSEPNAGSDLANLQTSAVIDGDHFVVNGQKIWTTLAHDATHIYLLVRTDREAKKQKGISFLLVDLDTPGITIRPIRNIAGHEEFCEVFFDNVRVPREVLVGNMNEGWTVAKALLGFERLNIGSPRRPQYALMRLEMLARSKGLFDDAGFLDRFTAIKLDLEDLAALYGRYVEQVKRGEPLGQDVSSLKIWAMEAWQRLTDLLVETGAEDGVIEGAQDIGGVEIDFLAPFYYARPGTIYGGSSEVQRNILSKYVLELPS